MRKIIIILGILTVSIFAQENEFQLSGNLYQDFVVSSVESNIVAQDSINIIAKKRKPIVSAGLSLLLPGAGQVYNKDYWKTAIFVAVEAAAIYRAITYNQKGNDQTQFYKDFANSPDGWSVDKYAHWSVDNAGRINPGIEENDPVLDIFDDHNNVVWSKLNTLEMTIGHWYSHQLAPFGDQQYYEMIGKYQQFNPGWSDYRDEDYPHEGYDGYTYPDPVTPTFKWYADQRGKANDYYNVASTAVIVLIANHVLSAVEAALATNSYNRGLKASVSLNTQNIGYYHEYYPKFNLSYNF